MEIDLRLILLGIGAVVIAVILLDGYRRKKKIQRQVEEFEETVLTNQSEGGQNLFLNEEDALFSQISAPRQVESKTPQTANTAKTQSAPVQDIIALTILPSQSAYFSGRTLNAAFQANQLKFGERRIFHKYRGDMVDGDILFSVASLTEPGSFEPNKIALSQFKGLFLFMDVASVHDPLPTFEKMLATARLMSHALGARICDESRNHLSAQVIEHLKERIRETQRRQLAREKSLDS